MTFASNVRRSVGMPPACTVRRRILRKECEREISMVGFPSG